jgi:predicted AAA+ superfamily ATPase
MTPSNIFVLCTPRADVLAGAVTESDFAADLAQVITGSAPKEYKDPQRFFENTYSTRGLKSLLANVCRRLSGAGGEAAAIFRLDTQFGGGKTHGLIALVHAARGLAGVANVPEFIDPALLPGPRRFAIPLREPT